MNALSINIPANFAADCNNTLKRYNAAQTDAERRAVLDRPDGAGPLVGDWLCQQDSCRLHEREGAEARDPSHPLPRHCVPAFQA